MNKMSNMKIQAKKTPGPIIHIYLLSDEDELKPPNTRKDTQIWSHIVSICREENPDLQHILGTQKIAVNKGKRCPISGFSTSLLAT